jgi:type I restriction enzyme S subunit
MTDSDSYEVWVSRGKPRVGDVVITREAPFGEACQIPKDIPAACLGQRMMMYQPNSEKVRADFLVYAIYSHAVQNRLLELAGGSTVGHIRVGDIRSLPIPHPVSLDEQREICEALNGVSSADVDSRSALTKLRRLKIGLMQDLLTGRVPVTSLLAEPQPALANT